MDNSKRRSFAKLVLIGTLFSVCLTLSAQKTAFEMAERMTRGINLGNTFDAKGYEGSWAPATKESDFEAFKEAGFSCVRIPITWHAALSSSDSTLRIGAEAPYKIQEAFFTRLDEVINWSLSRNLVTVINLHHEHWLKSQHVFEDEKARLYSLWTQLSEHYKDYPEELLFEILNEPHHSTNGEEDGLTQEQLDGLNRQALKIIRKTNPTRVTIYTGGGWSNLSDLEKTAPPDLTDKYLMATYHSYTPWFYAGEGNASWGTEEDKKTMENEFVQLGAYSKKYNLPVFIGEFGAQHKCEYNSRMLHYATYTENIQKYNVASAAWDDCGYLFKVYDRNTGIWDDTKDILVNYSINSPNVLQLNIADGNHIIIEWANRAKNIKKITIERRVGRKGKFEAIDTIESGEKYTDKLEKEIQTTYYYRIVNHFSDSTKLISYPQRIYVP